MERKRRKVVCRPEYLRRLWDCFRMCLSFFFVLSLLIIFVRLRYAKLAMSSV